MEKFHRDDFSLVWFVLLNIYVMVKFSILLFSPEIKPLWARSEQFAKRMDGKKFTMSKEKNFIQRLASGKTEIYFYSFSFPSFPTNRNCYFILRNHIYMCFVALCEARCFVWYGWFWTIHLFHFTMCMFFKKFSSCAINVLWYSPSRQLMCARSFVVREAKTTKRMKKI